MSIFTKFKTHFNLHHKPQVILGGILLFVSIHFSFSQVPNDICDQAQLVVPDKNSAFVCTAGKLTGAQPDSSMNACSFYESPAVWYKIPRDDDYGRRLNFSITSNDIERPKVKIFSGPCDDLGLVLNGFSSHIQECLTGINYALDERGIWLQDSTDYYIAVSCEKCGGGEFEICLNTTNPNDECNWWTGIEVKSRSSGGSLDGPFLPGETVSVCMYVNYFLATDCAGLQGFVPQFGSGWDLSEFIDGEPNFTTLNGASGWPAFEGVYDAKWKWFTDVGYHEYHPYLTISVDTSGARKLCHSLYENTCSGTEITSGECWGSCWQNFDQFLPPGWYAFSYGGCPNISGHPNGDYGDWGSCNYWAGPWEFCFDLKVKEPQQCDPQNGMLDLSLEFYTFNDNQIGTGWCYDDYIDCLGEFPPKVNLTGCCVPVTKTAINLPDICEHGVISMYLEDPSVDYWHYEFYQLVFETPYRHTSDFIDNGDSLHLPVDRLGNGDYLGTLRLSGYDHNGCIRVIREGEFTVFLYRDLDWERPAFKNTCLPDTFTYTPFANDYIEWEYSWYTDPPGHSDTGQILNGNTLNVILPEHDTSSYRFFFKFESLHPVLCRKAFHNGDFIVYKDDPVEAEFEFEIKNQTRVDFTNKSKNAYSYVWLFGDGSNATTFSPIHNYQYPGTYEVQLIATGACKIDTFVSAVVIPGQSPSVSIGYQTKTGIAPHLIKFYGYAYPLYPNTLWEWSFERGTPANSNQQDPVVNYERPGIFDVSLTVTNAYGSGTTTLTDFIIIGPGNPIGNNDEHQVGDPPLNPFNDDNQIESRGDQQQKSLLTISPNPAHDVLHVAYVGEDKPKMVKVYDSSGRKINETVWPENQKDMLIHLHSFISQSGLYFLVFESEEEWIVERIVVEM